MIGYQTSEQAKLLMNFMRVSDQAQSRPFAGLTTTVTLQSESNTRLYLTHGDPNAASRPKKALTAYNLFFKYERSRILDVTPIRPEGKPRRSHGKIGFANLARLISARWKNLNPTDREPFKLKAKTEQERYQKEMAIWNEQNKAYSAQATSNRTNGRKKTLQVTEPKSEAKNHLQNQNPCLDPSINDHFDGNEIVYRYSRSSWLEYLDDKLGEECREMFINMFPISRTFKSPSSLG